MNNWNTTKLNEIADVRDGTHDSPKMKKEGKYLVTSRHINNGKIDLTSANKISIKDFNEINKRSKVDKWDILFSMIGTVGEIALIDFVPDFAIKNVGLFKANNEDNAKWIYYYLKSPKAIKYIHSQQRGTTQAYITLGDLRKFPIEVPPLPTQRRIAGILSALDDKIENNRKTSETLEQIAQAVFKRWFVDGMDNNWTETTMGEVLDVKLGGTPATQIPEYWDGEIPWINSGEINKFRVFKPSRYISKIGLQKSATKLLPKGTTVIAITGATLGQVSLLEIDSCINQSVVGIIPNNLLSREYVYLWTQYIIKDLISHQTGGAQQHINKNVINSASIVIPPIEMLQKIQPVLKSLFDRISQLIFETENLIKTRDTLLPKLMSGEMEV